MIITLSGEPGSGKSTCAKSLASIFGLKHYSTGDLMRQIASERNMTLEQLSQLAEMDASLDKELDERQIRLGKTEDQFIIDGRLAAHFIPHAIKVFLTADLEERARRILHANRTMESFSSLEKAKEKLVHRQESEIKRYLAWYDFNPFELSTYDIVFDSSHTSIDEMVEKVRKKIMGKLCLT
ncbi:MAG: nucleoside monophosphate kinase [Candidatus Aureabacteria bacterium]|nr:nucleoside monophosphate kinase [Candidatus Auribacterota bacterium]